MGHCPFFICFALLILSNERLVEASSRNVPLSIPTARTGKVVSHLYRLQLTKMLSILNEDADPCENFFQHACGYYAEYMADEYNSEDGNDQDDHEPPVSPFLYNHEDRMHFFESNRPNFVTTPGCVLSELYENCKDRHRYDVWRVQPLSQWQRMLQEIPFLAAQAPLFERWPMLHYQWLMLSDDERERLDWVRLAAEFASHGVSSLLKVYFAEHTVFVALEDMDCPPVVSLKKQLLPLVYNGTGKKQVAHVLASELESLCRELTAEQSVDAVMNTTTRQYNETLVTYFDYYFQNLNMTAEQVSSARTIIIDPPRLQQLVALLRSTAPRVVFNFVLWRAYESLRYPDCFQLTDEFESLLLAEYWHWHIFEMQALSRNVALATYLYHTTRFQQHRRTILMSAQWDRFLFARLQRSDFNLPRILANYASNHLDAANMALVYDAATLRPGAFYGNVLALRRAQLRHSFFTPHIDAEDYNHPLYFLRHFLHFTISSLQRPLFHYFATLGFDLWHNSDLLFSTDGFYTALDCLERQSLLHFDDAPIFQVLEEAMVAEIFRFYRAFTESYRDYKFWLAGESFAFAEEFVLEHFQLDSNRSMFYAVAQLYCGRNDGLYSMLINRSFMNMPQFEVAFKCDTEAPMNPVVKCMVSHCNN